MIPSIQIYFLTFSLCLVSRWKKILCLEQKMHFPTCILIILTILFVGRLDLSNLSVTLSWFISWKALESNLSITLSWFISSKALERSIIAQWHDCAPYRIAYNFISLLYNYNIVHYNFIPYAVQSTVTIMKYLTRMTG